MRWTNGDLSGSDLANERGLGSSRTYQPSDLVVNRNALGSGATAPYGRIDDTGRVELSQETMKKMGADSVTLPAETSGVPERKKEKRR